ncbi:MAG: mobile mystery protein A [Candidatus Sericytochromatia bacterium]|uniref:Mobile mystery protein A n=1 Tax=Candidatus Tanganyikabacteria bacterium TaxID=2961651 RepID=A0A938BJV7_9BACT|nr:mobile mystery protein A [Candidatus Tanganyikabacteria bacterium]
MARRLSVIQLRQLEDRLDRIRGSAAVDPPRDGWLRTIRLAIGMTTEQLADRLGVTRQAVLQLEAAERKQTASWTSLRKAANAMDCDVLVALVPRGSLTQVLTRQGRVQAERHLARASHSMKLDAHVVGQDEMARQVEELADELATDRPRGLWAPEPTPPPPEPPPKPFHGKARRVV